MNRKPGKPGISRDERISAEGLQRLARQLEHGSQIGNPVLTQWIRRYGESAREIIRRHGRYHEGLEPKADGAGEGPSPRAPKARQGPRR